jgi:hypothetical protein
MINLPQEIIIKICYLQPIKCSLCSKYIYNIINNDVKLIKYISKKFYRHFALLLYDETKSYNELFKLIKSISYLFYTNLSINEKNNLFLYDNILSKSYIDYNTEYNTEYNQYFYTFIIFYTLKYLEDSIDIYIDKNIFSIGKTTYNIYFNFKHYKLYKYNKYKYDLIIKNDDLLDYSIILLNKLLYNINNL